MGILERSVRWIAAGALIGGLSGLVGATAIISAREVDLAGAYLAAVALGSIFGVLGALIATFMITIAEAPLARAGGSSTGTGLIVVFGTVAIGLALFIW